MCGLVFILYVFGNAKIGIRQTLMCVCVNVVLSSETCPSPSPTLPLKSYMRKQVHSARTSVNGSIHFHTVKYF